jgi:hypothetical protein
MNNFNRNRRQNNAPATKQQIKDLRREINPCVVVRSARSQPTPKTLSKTTWIRRSYGFLDGSGAELTVGDISSNIGAPAGTSFKILKIHVWALLPSTTIAMTCDVGAISTGLGQLVSGADVGTNSNLAGLTFDIPDPIAKTIAIDTASTTKVLTPSNPAGGVAPNVWYQLNVAIQVY